MAEERTALIRTFSQFMKIPGILLASLTLSPLHAADFKVTPADSATLSSTFNETMNPGDRLVLGPGEYKDLRLDLKNGGTDGSPKTIEAMPGAVLVSSWDIARADKGATAISLAPGLSHTTFKNLAIRSYCFVVKAGESKETPRTDLIFDGVKAEQMRHGFYLSDCDSMTFENCSLIRYSKHGYRFEQGCDNVVMRNCLADCSEGDAVWETKTEMLPFGFLVNGGSAPNTKFRFENCVSKNNIKSNQNQKYTNGDGFVIEGNTTDVKFVRCIAIRNQDAGFDLKVDAVTLTDCVSIDCRRSFRLWKTGTIENCFSSGTAIGVWTKGGPISVSNTTLIELGRAAAETDGKNDKPITLKNCIYLPKEGAKNYSPKIGNIVFEDCVGEGVGFKKPTDQWDGTGENFNSTSHPDMGYSSARVKGR